MKYFVVGIRWSDTKKAVVKYIAGEFDTFINASLFQQAYNEHFKANAEIISDYKIFNGE